MNRPAGMLLALVRNALNGAPVEETLLRDATKDQWEQVIRMAGRQGVCALTFHSVSALPETLRPPRDLYLGWAVNAHHLAERYRQQEAVAGELARLLEKHSLQLMILKGLGTSHYYPCPHLRECGDIDIYLFGRDKEGDRIAREMGLEVREHNAKHSQFVFQGMLVENHRTFLDETLYAMDRRLDRELLSILKRKPCREIRIGSGRIWLPPAEFDALFLIRHTAMHFTEGFSLRHLIDWTCFLSVEGPGLNATPFRKHLHGEGLERFAGALTAAACLYLGLPEDKAPLPIRAYRKDASRILDALSPEKAVRPASGRHMATLAYKTRRFLAGQSRYRMVYGRLSFPHRVVLSIKSHLRHPETIFGDHINPEKP